MPMRSHHDVLERIAENLDIPRPRYDAAVRHYESIGEWLGRDGSALSGYDLRVFPQGSILLGTVTRPIRETEQYDIDLVCRVEGSKQSFTQRDLKEAVGNEIRSYANTRRHVVQRPKEGRICWTLRYRDDVQFHMDIVPALPNAEPYRRELRRFGYAELAKSPDLSGQAIAITDNTSPGYSELCDDWPSSNPLGYATWFRECMRQQFVRLREAMAGAAFAANVDDIPEHQVKTPLQRAIQLLKRHRDLFFHDHPNKRPASIIVTTLAARAYRSQADIASALSGILPNMSKYVEDQGGVVWIPNPVYPKENFADRWREDPQKRSDFDHWLRTAQRDFGEYLRGSRYRDLPQDLRQRLGTNLVDHVLQSIPNVAPAAAVAVGNDGAHRAAVEAEAIRRRGQHSKPWARG